MGRADPDAASVGFGGNVSGTLVSDREQTKPRSTSIFSIIPLEKTEQTSNSKHVLSLNDESRTAASMKEQDKPKESLEGNSVKYDATGRMIRDNTAPVPERKPPQVPPVPEHKPEIISPTAKGNELSDFIGKLESSDNYNVIVGGKEKPLTKMTIKQILQLQKDLDNKKQDTAVGRYQIKNSTLKETISKLGIDENEIFDKNLQDKMGRQLLKKRGFEDYKAGKISTKELIKKLSMEWVALPTDESNESYYKGIGNNKARTNFKTIKELLEKK